MSHTALFLWISAAPLASQHTADIRDFAASRGLGTPLVRTFSSEPAFGLAVGEGATSASASARRMAPAAELSREPQGDAERADALERELERARTAIARLEPEQAALGLRRVESELRAHAELPQAAFLLAECFALQALAAPSTRQALEAEAARATLEGARAKAFAAPGAASFGSDDGRAGLAAAAPRVVHGLAAGDELELDGAAASLTPALMPGLHQARVLRRGRAVFSQFFELGADQNELTLSVPEITPCSDDDFARLALTGESVTSARNVSCGNYFIVAEAQGGIRVASCGGGLCSDFARFEHRPPPLDAAAPAPRPGAGPRSSLPLWAAVGAATALTVSAIVLWRAGVFDGEDQGAPGWQFGGTRAALRF